MIPSTAWRSPHVRGRCWRTNIAQQSVHTLFTFTLRGQMKSSHLRRSGILSYMRQTLIVFIQQFIRALAFGIRGVRLKVSMFTYQGAARVDRLHLQDSNSAPGLFSAETADPPAIGCQLRFESETFAPRRNKLRRANSGLKHRSNSPYSPPRCGG